MEFGYLMSPFSICNVKFLYYTNVLLCLGFLSDVVKAQLSNEEVTAAWTKITSSSLQIEQQMSNYLYLIVHAEEEDLYFDITEREET